MRRACLLGCLLILCATTVAPQDQDSTPNNSAAPAPAAQTPNQASGATSAAPGSTRGADIAHLRVYRSRRAVGAALAPSIVVDGKPVARVGNGRRVTIRLTPGPHTIASDDKSSAISIDAKAGQDYYVRVEEAMGMWKGHGKLTLLMPEQGSAEYKLEKPIEPDRKLAKEMIEDDADEAAPQGKTQ